VFYSFTFNISDKPPVPPVQLAIDADWLGAREGFLATLALPTPVDAACCDQRVLIYNGLTLGVLLVCCLIL
jgi:hypothetical protein